MEKVKHLLQLWDLLLHLLQQNALIIKLDPREGKFVRTLPCVCEMWWDTETPCVCHRWGRDTVCVSQVRMRGSVVGKSDVKLRGVLHRQIQCSPLSFSQFQFYYTVHYILHFYSYCTQYDNTSQTLTCLFHLVICWPADYIRAWQFCIVFRISVDAEDRNANKSKYSVKHNDIDTLINVI